MSEESSSSLIQESQEVSVVRKFLAPLPMPSRPVKKPSGARILTSDECLAMLEEKRLSKEREAQEKEERKKKRVEKKKQKEDEKKRKASSVNNFFTRGKLSRRVSDE